MNRIAILKSLICTVAFSLLTGAVPYVGIYSLFIAILLYWLFDSVKTDSSLSARLCSAVFGVFSFLHVFQVNVYEDVLAKYPAFGKAFVLVVIFAGVYLFAKTVLSYAYALMDKWTPGKRKLSPNILFVIFFELLILLYLPAWMMEFPGIVPPDTLDQIGQITSNVYINHHPFAHTMWLKLLLSFGTKMNVRVGIAGLLQLIINALVFALVIKTVYKKTGSLTASIVVFLFYGLMSFHAFYNVTLIKDTTHAALTCSLLMLLIGYFDERTAKRKNIYTALILLFSVLFCLFRTNGYYAFVVLILVSFVYAIKTRDFKLSAVMLIAIVLATIIKGPVYTSLGVSKASYAEALSVPAQQIAYVIKNGRYLTDEEIEMVGAIIEIGDIPQYYDYFLSDPIKHLMNNHGNISYLESHKLQYLLLWVKIGIRYPLDYLRAWVNQCSGFFTPHYYSTSIFWGVWNNELGITSAPLIGNEALIETLQDLAAQQHEIPLFGVLHYPAVSVWITVIMICYALRNRDEKSLVIIAPLFGIFLTLLLSCPYNLSFRYSYAITACLPLLIMYPLVKRRKKVA